MSVSVHSSSVVVLAGVRVGTCDGGERTVDGPTDGGVGDVVGRLLINGSADAIGITVYVPVSAHSSSVVVRTDADVY